jgi:hypothetical protein
MWADAHAERQEDSMNGIRRVGRERGVTKTPRDHRNVRLFPLTLTIGLAMAVIAVTTAVMPTAAQAATRATAIDPLVTQSMHSYAASITTTTTSALSTSVCRTMLNQGKANLTLSVSERAVIAKLPDTSCTLKATNTVQRLTTPAIVSGIQTNASAAWCESVWTSANFYYGPVWFMTSHANGAMCFNGHQVWQATQGGWFECHEDMFPGYFSNKTWCGVWNSGGWYAEMGENYDYWPAAAPWAVTHFYVRTGLNGSGWIGNTHGGLL